MGVCDLVQSLPVGTAGKTHKNAIFRQKETEFGVNISQHGISKLKYLIM